MKKISLVSNDGKHTVIVTNNPRYIQFAKDMAKAGLIWRAYSGRGMDGAYCPASVTEPDKSVEAIIRATTVQNLKRDTLGYEYIVYP